MLSYSEKFIAIRKQLRLSQDALAERLGVSGSAIGLIEQGKTKNPGADLLAALASKLGVSINWVLLDKGEMFASESQRDSRWLDLFTDAVPPSTTNQPLAPFLANNILIDNDLFNNRRDAIYEGPQPSDDMFVVLGELSELLYLSRYNLERKNGLIKEYYEIITPEIFRLAAQGRNAHNYILYWDFDRSNNSLTPNSNNAWNIIRNIPLGLYPNYPILNYFVDFADPYRKIAIFIEEADSRWEYSVINYQDKVLSLYGWRTFRIPLAVAKTSEYDLLPIELINVYNEDIEDGETLQERRKWDLELSTKAMDSFFYWLKSAYFKDELFSSIQARKRAIDVWNGAIITYHFDSEGDMLDKIVFGQTSSEWRFANSSKRNKSIRNHASDNQLIVLVNLEGINAILIKNSRRIEERFKLLIEHALSAFSLLGDNSNKNRVNTMLKGIDRALVEGPF